MYTNKQTQKNFLEKTCTLHRSSSLTEMSCSADVCVGVHVWVCVCIFQMCGNIYAYECTDELCWCCVSVCVCGVCVCVCVCLLCLLIYLCIQMYFTTSIYKHMHLRRSSSLTPMSCAGALFVCVCVCVCVCILYVRSHIQIYTCIHKHTHTCVIFMFVYGYHFDIFGYKWLSSWSIWLQIGYRMVVILIYLATNREWRRLIGSPKLHIIFHKRATKYRSLLRKMTYKDKGSYESPPPCIYVHIYANTNVSVRVCLFLSFLRRRSVCMRMDVCV